MSMLRPVWALQGADALLKCVSYWPYPLKSVGAVCLKYRQSGLQLNHRVQGEGSKR